ncbi:hypothetical protein JTB14_025565 [Gonioctena quinquepunctata]|nr:hypothetical protein JTB14_025565 [Gonioctena quinquepunctata]
MASSDTSPVWKRIYPIISGGSPNITTGIVDDLLKLCKPKIMKLFLEYKPYTRESFKSWKAQSGLRDLVSDDEMSNFIHMLSRELDLEVTVAWTIICNFLMFEYYGKVDELKTLIKYDSKVQYLTENIWYFYTADRMFLLKILRHIFECVTDKEHIYSKVFSAFINSIDMRELWNNLRKVFDNLIDELDREKAQSFPEGLVTKWIHRNNREQIEVVLLLMHTLQYMKVDGSELKDVLYLFIRHGFSRHPLYQKSLNISRPSDLLEIKNAEIALVLAVMREYWQAPDVIKHFPVNVERNLELLQIQGDNSIVLFGWSIMKTSIGAGIIKDAHMEYSNQTAMELVQKKVFVTLHELLMHRMFLNCGPGEILVEALYKLFLEFTKSSTDQTEHHDQPGVPKLATELLKRKGMIVLENLGPFFQFSMEAFPFVFEPFLDMCGALLIIPERYDSMMSLLRSIPGFLAEIPWNDQRQRFNLVGTQNLFEDSNMFVIPEGTVVECFNYLGMEFARFLYPFSFFRLMEQFTKSFTTISFELGTTWPCYENLSQLVTIGYSFISHLLNYYKGNFREDKELRHVIHLLDVVPDQFAKGPTKNFDLVILYFEINFKLIRRGLFDYMEAFQPTQRKKCMPSPIIYRKEDRDSIFGSMYNGCVLLKSLREEEGQMRHSLLIQYLELIEYMVQKNLYQKEVQLPGVGFVINCVYPLYQQWAYEDPTEETDIPKLCCSIFVNVLQRHLSKVTDDSVLVFDLLIDSMLHQELMTTSFVAIFLKNKFYLQNLMEQESNWLTGPGVNYFECIRLHLVTLLLVFKHKSRMPNVKNTLDNKIGFIAKCVLGYIVNPYSIPLKKLACRFLEFLARDRNIPLMALLGLDYDQVQRLFLDRLRDSTEDDDLKIYILDLIGTCILHQHGMTAAFFNVKRSRKWYSDNKEKTIEGDTVSDFMIDYLHNIKKSHEYLKSPLQTGILHIMANLWVSRKRHLIDDVVALEAFWPLLADPLFRDFTQKPCVYTQILKIFGIQLAKEENESRFLAMVEKFVTDSKQVKLWKEFLWKLFKGETTNFEGIEERRLLLRSWMKFIIMLEKTPELRKFHKDAKNEFILLSLEGAHYFIVNTYCLGLWIDLCLIQLSYWGIPDKEKYSEISKKAISMFSILKNFYADLADSVRLSILSTIQHVIQNLRDYFEVNPDELMELLEQFGSLMEYEYAITKDRMDVEKVFDVSVRDLMLPWTLCVRITNGLFQFKCIEDISVWFTYRNYVNKLMECTCDFLNHSPLLPLAKMTLYSLCLYAESPMYLDFLNINMTQFFNTIEPPLTALLYGQNNRLNTAQLEEGWTICTLLLKFQTRLFQSIQYKVLPSSFDFLIFFEKILLHIFNIPETVVALKALDLIINTLLLFDTMLRHWQLEWYRKSNNTYNFMKRGVMKIINACLYTLLRPKNIIVYFTDQYNKIEQIEKIPVDLMVEIMNKLMRAVCLGLSILYKVNPSLITLMTFIPDTTSIMIENDFSVPKFQLPIGSTLTYGMLLCLAHFFCKTLDALDSKKQKSCLGVTDVFYSRFFGLVEHQDFSNNLPNQKLSAFLRYAMYEYSGLADPWIEKLNYDQVQKSLEALMLFLSQQIFLAVRTVDRDHLPYFKRNLNSELQFFYEHVKKHTSMLLSEQSSRTSLYRSETDILKRYCLQSKESGGSEDIIENNFCLIISYWFTNVCRISDSIWNLKFVSIPL